MSVTFLFIYFTFDLASVPDGTEVKNKAMAKTEKGRGNGVNDKFNYFCSYVKTFAENNYIDCPL